MKIKQKGKSDLYENIFDVNDEMMMQIQNRGYRHSFNLVLLLSIISVFAKKLVFGYSDSCHLEIIIMLISFFNVFFSFIWKGLIHFKKGIYKLICLTGLIIITFCACIYGYEIRELFYHQQIIEFFTKMIKETAKAYVIYCGSFFLLVCISNWRYDLSLNLEEIDHNDESIN